MDDSRRLRSFYCPDNLWNAVEDEAERRGVTIDEFIADALRDAMADEPLPTARTQVSTGRPLDQLLRAAALHPQEPHESITSASKTIPMEIVRAPRPGDTRPADAEVAVRTPANERARTLHMRRPDPPTSPDPARMNKRLFLIFEGQEFEVTGDRFVIGRGSSGTDLKIRDANVSRKHAAVILHDGAWYIQDLQSTNGIEYMGRRIDARRVEHGDNYMLCEYELAFEYRD